MKQSDADLLVRSRGARETKNQEEEYIRQQSIKRAEKFAEADAKASIASSTVDTRVSTHPAVVAQRHSESEEYGANRNDDVAAAELLKMKKQLGMRT